MKCKSERTTAGGMSGRERPDSARTTLRACATCPVESHLSHLIPLNPGESRLKKSWETPEAASVFCVGRARGRVM